MSDDATTPIATVPKNGREELRVALTEYRGTPLVDVRTFVDLREPGDRQRGDRQPTKKGVALKVQHLPALIEALQAAAGVALSRGLITAPAEQPAQWWNRD